MSITKRDDKGRILPGGKAIDSETGRAMSRKRWDKDHNDDVVALLEQAGYTADNAPTHLRILAEKAVVSGSGSVTALGHFVKEVRSHNPIDPPVTSGKWDFINGPCATCGFDVDNVKIPVWFIDKLAHKLQVMAELREIERG